MTVRIQATLAATMTDAATTAIDTGGGTAFLQVYSGVKPATIGTALGAQVKLLEYPLPNPSFAAAAPGGPGAVALGNFVGDTAIGLAAANATWARILSRGGAVVADMDVTATGGGGDVEISTIAITVGLNVDVTAAQLTHAA